ncbi:MAG: alpha/beta hydrolase [Candidatus Heimdallarchaeota archaeon]|nr:MAG: alpha/beta hydrolase [Candidatus Heimdallarchaeota archaeon]
MPSIELEDINVHYEINGKGAPFVFIQGAFVSSTMWENQVNFFSKSFQTLVYDLRGHGITGPSSRKKYSVDLYADDLVNLLDALNIDKPIICGISLGGMIAQVFATKYPERLSALILADTAATITLTHWDYIMRYLIGPKWLMLLSLRMMGVHRFIKFSFWLGKFTRSKEWLGNEEIIEYEKNEMLNLNKKEYLKIFGSLYDFKLQKLAFITVPTLVVNGEHEAKSIFKHAEKIQSLIPNCDVDIIKNAGHTSNMENPNEFNQKINDFLQKNNIE